MVNCSFLHFLAKSIITVFYYQVTTDWFMCHKLNFFYMTKSTKWVCAQRRLRSAWASAQSDQSLCCTFNGQLRTQGFFRQTAKTLIRQGGCPGWSESSLGAHSFGWFCHVVAQLLILMSQYFPYDFMLFFDNAIQTSMPSVYNLTSFSVCKRITCKFKKFSREDDDSQPKI